jgi:hypothetical protein
MKLLQMVPLDKGGMWRSPGVKVAFSYSAEENALALGVCLLRTVGSEIRPYRSDPVNPLRDLPSAASSTCHRTEITE